MRSKEVELTVSILLEVRIRSHRNLISTTDARQNAAACIGVKVVLQTGIDSQPSVIDERIVGDLVAVLGCDQTQPFGQASAKLHGYCIDLPTSGRCGYFMMQVDES